MQNSCQEKGSSKNEFGIVALGTARRGVPYEWGADTSSSSQTMGLQSTTKVLQVGLGGQVPLGVQERVLTRAVQVSPNDILHSKAHFLTYLIATL